MPDNYKEFLFLDSELLPYFLGLRNLDLSKVILFLKRDNN